MVRAKRARKGVTYREIPILFLIGCGNNMEISIDSNSLFPEPQSLVYLHSREQRRCLDLLLGWVRGTATSMGHSGVKDVSGAKASERQDKGDLGEHCELLVNLDRDNEMVVEIPCKGKPAGLIYPLALMPRFEYSHRRVELAMAPIHWGHPHARPPRQGASYPHVT